jgi:hypothetical protein
VMAAALVTTIADIPTGKWTARAGEIEEIERMTIYRYSSELRTSEMEA